MYGYKRIARNNYLDIKGLSDKETFVGQPLLMDYGVDTQIIGYGEL